MLFRLFNADQRQRLFDNIARSIGPVSADIQDRQIEHFRRADPAYAGGVIEALGRT